MSIYDERVNSTGVKSTNKLETERKLRKELHEASKKKMKKAKEKGNKSLIDPSLKNWKVK